MFDNIGTALVQAVGFFGVFGYFVSARPARRRRAGRAWPRRGRVRAGTPPRARAGATRRRARRRFRRRRRGPAPSRPRTARARRATRTPRRRRD